MITENSQNPFGNQKTNDAQDGFWQEETAATEAVLKYCPDEIQKFVTLYIGKYVTNGFTADEWTVWNEVIASNPIVQRLVYYTYSPIDAYDVRSAMLCVWCYQGDPLVPHEPALVAFDLSDDIDRLHALKENDRIKDQEELKGFISRLQDDASRTLIADIRKIAGAEGSIEELRGNSFRIKYNSDGKPVKGIIDLSPFYRIEEFFGRKEIHYHVLADDPQSIEDAFSDEDIYLIRWFRMFRGTCNWLSNEAFSDKTKVTIFNRNGKKITPPKKYYKNPYCSSLLPKFSPLIKKTVGERFFIESKYESIPVHVHDEESERKPFEEISNDVKSTFFELVLKYDPEKYANFAGFVKKGLWRKVRDLRDRGFHRIDIEYEKETERPDEEIINKEDESTRKVNPFRDEASQLDESHFKKIYEEFVSDPTNKRIFELLMEGKNQKQIGDEIGISRQQVSKRTKQLQLKIEEKNDKSI